MLSTRLLSAHRAARCWTLIPAGRLVITSDQTYYRGVICELDYGVGARHRNAVMGQQGVQMRAYHALGDSKREEVVELNLTVVY